MIRKDGDLVPFGDELLESTRLLAMFQEFLPPENRSEFEKHRDTDFAYEIEHKGRFRVNLFVGNRGPAAVFRAIPSKILSADDLGLPEAVRALCELDKGLVLVTGPTGSGKSTTLTAMIDLINRTRTDHIRAVRERMPAQLPK